jgi:hypothetical protein
VRTVISSEVEGVPVFRFALPSGHVVQIDEADRALVEQHRWFIRRGRRGKLYVRGYLIGVEDRTPRLHLHRVLTSTPDGFEVDHINGDGLDNRRANLRVVTHAQNIHNNRGYSKSGYKGVTWCRLTARWRAKIQVAGVTQHLGRFDDPWTAAEAYNDAARAAFGDHAYLNRRRP